MQPGATLFSRWGPSTGPFSHAVYTIKRPFWSLLNRTFYVYAPDGSQVLYVKHPLLRLRREVTMYADESENYPIMTIRARQIVALNRANDVFDAQTGERLGTIRSRGLESIVRDTWDILDTADQPVGLIREQGESFLRRVVPLLTGEWHIELYGRQVAHIRQAFRFFVSEFTLDLSMNDNYMDPRFAVACTLMALMAETARESNG